MARRRRRIRRSRSSRMRRFMPRRRKGIFATLWTWLPLLLVVFLLVHFFVKKKPKWWPKIPGLTKIVDTTLIKETTVQPSDTVKNSGQSPDII